MRPSVLVLSVDANTSRCYLFNNKSADGTVLYFRCRRCANLNKADPVTGASYVVTVHVEDGTLKYPYGEEHHPKCCPRLNGELKALEIHRKHKLGVRRGQETPYRAYVKAVHDAKRYGDALDFIGSWASVDASYEKQYNKFLSASQLDERSEDALSETLGFGHGRQMHDNGNA